MGISNVTDILGLRLGACGAVVVSVVSAALGALACSNPAAQPARRLAPNDVVATVGSRSITLAEVDETALEQPAGNFGNEKLSQALYDARRAALDDAIGAILFEQEAKARGVDRATLVEQEVDAKARQVSDADVQAWYDANQSRVQGAPLDQIRIPIRTLLTQERARAARQAFVERLRAGTPVKILLASPRRVVNAADGPTRGPASAPVEMIEFSDFQCPFCQRVKPALQRVLDTYGERIRFVFRNYPLSNHSNARPAAEAAACAGEQGQFWPYHDRLFASPGKLTEADLKQSATDLGLDRTRFDSCVDSHKYSARIDADIKAGDEAGVSGTPAFFINGRLLSGAQPYEAFKRLIDEELELKKP